MADCELLRGAGRLRLGARASATADTSRLSPAVLAHFYGTQRLGSVLGALYTSGGVGVLMGPPVAGFIIGHSGYRWAIAFSLTTGLASYFALLPLDGTRELTPNPFP